MNKSKSSRFLLLTIIISIVGFKAFSQNNPKIIADSLTKYIEPIHHNGDSIPDYSNVINLLKSKEIVTLGESTHGTKEIFDGKVQIIKGLVKTGNFKTIFMETDYSGLLKLDTVLRLSNDTGLYKRFMESGLYSIYKTKEVYNLFAWVKEYNRTQTEKEKVFILGADMIDASLIVNQLFRVLPDSGKNNSIVYNSLMKILTLYASDKPVIFNKQEQLANGIMLSELNVISEKTENRRLKYLVKLIDQSLTLISINDYAKRSAKRDEFMADNVLWMKSNISNNGKAIVWVHNGHVAHVKAFNKLPMGYYLKESLKDKVYTLAFAFNEGMVRIKDIDPKYKGVYQQRYFASSDNAKSIEYYFKNCKPQDFFLDFNKLNSSEYLTNLLKKNNYMRTIGSRYLGGGDRSFNPAPVLDGFDGIIFFNKTNAAVGL